METGFDSVFDASVGLTFSLRAFEKYRKSGLLAAEVRGVPGLRGAGRAYIELIQGKVIACYVVDRNGERHSQVKEVLTRLDEERGPFKWVFYADPDSSTPVPRTSDPRLQSLASSAVSPVFRPLVSYLEPQHLQPWTPQQQQFLCAIFTMINGKNSLDDIKAYLALPPTIIDEGVRVLLILKVISL